MSSKPDGAPSHTPRDDRSPFFITGSPESTRTQRSTKTDVQGNAEGLASLTQKVNQEVKRRLTPQQYEVGGHKLKVDGINQSGSVVLSVRLADDGHCDPWTDVIADEVAASNAQSELDSQARNTHEFLSQHLPDVYTDPISGVNTTATSPEPSRSPLHAFSQPPTPTAASPATSVAAPGPTAPPSQQPFAASAAAQSPTQTTASAVFAFDAQHIRTPTRASSVYLLSQAAQQAESSRAAVEQLVANAISAVKHAHQEGCIASTGALGDAAATAAAEDEKERQGHGQFVGVPLQPIAGAYSIAILVVGTRGDVQPFLAIARELSRYGHRVRIATHSIYRKFVEDHKVEFYPLGGDPTILSEFVVRNRGILPGGGSKGLMNDIREQEEQVRQIVWSTWPACTEPDPLRPSRPFRATALIANPPSISHVCCAEALQIPLHIMFTMPWTPTKAFPHPMAVVQSINVAGAISSLPNDFISGAANYYSYKALDLYLWMGFAAVLEDLRKHLGLPPYPLATTGPAHAVASLRLPFTYLWSPSLQPKPADWGSHIDVTGFVFLDEDAATYTPPPELTAFIAPRYEAPIYIGFGSLVLSVCTFSLCAYLTKLKARQKPAKKTEAYSFQLHSFERHNGGIGPSRIPCPC